MLDKNRPISRFNHKLLALSTRMYGSKVNIWLNMALYSVKLVLFYVALLSPITASAGVFSFISDMISGKEADAQVRQTTTQTMALLEANLGPSATSPIGGGEIAIVGGTALIQETGVIGTQADLVESKSNRISLYVVRKGDTLSQIAEMFDVTINTIKWANNITGPIREGDELVILPIPGVSHVVKKGDTIKSIATKYKADISDIESYNEISSGDVLAIGTKLIVPNGQMQMTPVATVKTTSKARSVSGPLYTDYYMRPIVGGVRSQGIHGLNAVDLAAPIGTPIYASADGVVTIARGSGYNGGYGSYVVISHANGTQTLYAHMNKVSITQGTIVSRGDAIGTVGNSGKSTGPHVHFEIRGATNPF